LHKELRDRQGANIASRKKEMCSEKLFHVQKNDFGEDQPFFIVVLSQKNAKEFEQYLNNPEICIKTYSACLRKVYSEFL